MPGGIFINRIVAAVLSLSYCLMIGGITGEPIVGSSM